MSDTESSITPHLQHIRDALWRTPGIGLASVMVGSGFSRNAEPSVIGARKFPLWDELARSMANEIGLKENTPRDPLQIAQMYAAMRGSIELTRMIERQIPDADYRPGEIHRRLLKLNWADVFTTNYDTLLERAKDEVFDRRYELIRSPLDIPMRCRPRLVKLHGTLGSGAALIATQEDYRLYPENYPGFVNMVREAVMETVFVLIGFAGDDPNFLEWSGWVRDVLGDSAPKIYLCGLLDPSPAVRALLDIRHVTPVDLSPLFPKSLGDERHAKALDWLLAALESGKPSRPLAWAPDSETQVVQRNPALPPAKAFTPFSVSPPTRADGEVDISADKLRQITRVWQMQRSEYPGWHVAPDSIRTRVWGTTKRWRSYVFNHAKVLAPVERLFLVRELCWRLELCLSPVFTNEAEQIAGWLELVNPFGSKLLLPSAQITNEEADPDLINAWRALTLHVVRTAREDLDEQRFRLWCDRLTKVASNEATIRSELRNEQVLWHLTALELPAFRSALATWRSEARQPLEFARLATYYAETGDTEAASELALAALQGIRTRGRTEEATSMDAWCCMLLRALQWPRDGETMEWRERIELAKANGYSPWETIERLQHDLRDIKPGIRPAIERVAGFDAGDIRTTHHLGVDEDAVMPAFRLLRLIERAPCPVHVGWLKYLGDSVTHAAVWLESGAPFWSLSMLLRAKATPQDLQEKFDRASIALLEPERAQLLFRLLGRVVRDEFARLGVAGEKGSDDLGQRILLTATELLSRVAFRASPEDLEALLIEAAVWMANPSVIARHDLAEPISVLISRSIEALPDFSVTRAVELFLTTPMPGELGCAPFSEGRWPEPFDSLSDRVAKPPSQRASTWGESWQRLLAAMRSADPQLRGRAVNRACFLFWQHWLTPVEVEALADAIWSQIQPETGLPCLLRFPLSALLHMPGASEHGVQEKVKQALLAREFGSWKTKDGGYNLGSAAQTQRELNELRSVFCPPVLMSAGTIVLPITAGEARELTQRLVHWWPMMMEVITKPSIRRFPLHGIDPEEFAGALCRFIGESLLLQLPISDGAVASIENCLEQLSVAGFSLIEASVGRLFHKPELLSGITSAIERGLLSENAKLVRSSTVAIRAWRRVAGGLSMPQVPARLRGLLVSRIVSRRAPSLDAVLSRISGLVEDGLEWFDEEQVHLMIASLDQIAPETHPQRLRERHARGEIERTDIIETLNIRAWAGRLAGALTTAFLAQKREIPPALGRWKTICEEDPLPEVRHAWRTD